MEIWKDIKGFENYYKISNKGRVIRKNRYKKGKGGCLIFLKSKYLSLNKKEHTHLTLINGSIKKHTSVHREVFINFVGEIKDGNVINHIDGDSTNNDVSNLESVTQSENINHYYKLKNLKNVKVEITLVLYISYCLYLSCCNEAITKTKDYDN